MHHPIFNTCNSFEELLQYLENCDLLNKEKGDIFEEFSYYVFKFYGFI
jgi:hypothetical protein